MTDPDHVSNSARTALLWPENTAALNAFLSAHPKLQRIYLLTSSQNSSSCSDQRIVPLLFSTPQALLDTLSEIIHQDALFFVEGRFISYIASCHLQQHPLLKQMIDQTVLYHIRQLVSIAALRAYRGWHMLANTILNIERICTEPTLDELRHKATGATVVVVGAGPSLDDNVHQLAAQQKKVFIVACDGAWKSLSCAGVAPDLIVTTDDSEKVWRYFEHGRREKNPPPVACLQQSSWPVVRHYPGRLLFGKPKSFDTTTVKWFPDLPEWDTGLCVGHAALECAYLMNAAQIILIGFDLGYKQDVFHPKHMPMPYFHHNPPQADNLTTVPGIDGKPVQTDLSMAFYLQEFNKRIARHDIQVWDATEGGAILAGTRIVTLEQALTECPVPEKGLPALNPALRIKTADNEVPALHQAAEALSNGIQDICAQSFKPTATTSPLEQLAPYQALLDLLTQAQNPVQHAALQFAWLDWLKNPHDVRLGQELMQAIQTHLSDLFILTQMTQVLTAMPRPSTERSKPNCMLFSDSTMDTESASDDLSGLKNLAATWTCSHSAETGNLVQIWQELLQQAVHVVITINGNLLPAAWGMPGCQCLDYRTTTPDTTLLHEQWIPGYAVITTQPDVAAAWRQIIPADHSVYLIIAHTCYRIDTHTNQTPITWEEIV